jgi:NitT/TauT family transport system substrate-binding protein
MKKTIATLLVVALLVVGLTQCDRKPQGEGLSTTLRLNWIYTGSFAGEVLGQKEFAKKHNLDLKIQPGGQGLDPIKLVGDDQFGAAAADEILAANDKGADLVIIGVINYDSPAAFVSKAADNIKTPKDFEGKKVGVLPFGSTGLVYKSLLKKNNVDASRITEQTVSPDLKLFLLGNYNVQPIFAYDEPVTLEAQGVDYNLIEPRKFDVKFKGPCYFTRRSTVEKNPGLVQAFVNTMADGWREAIKDPGKAISALKQLSPTIDEARERKVVEKGIPYYSGYQGKPLASDIDSWKEMIDDLKSFGIIKGDVDLNKVLNFTFINKYYEIQPK